MSYVSYEIEQFGKLSIDQSLFICLPIYPGDIDRIKNPLTLHKYPTPFFTDVQTATDYNYFVHPSAQIFLWQLAIQLGGYPADGIYSHNQRLRITSKRKPSKDSVRLGSQKDKMDIEWQKDSRATKMTFPF